MILQIVLYFYYLIYSVNVCNYHLLSLSDVGGSEYRTSPDPSQTVTATFHQKSARRGLSKYRGAQCTSMALAAVLTSTCLPLDAWNTSDLDAVLRYGDRLHQHLISRVDRRSTDPRLALHEIPAGEGFTYMVPSPIQGDKWFAENYPHTVIKTMSKSLDFYGPVNSAKPCRHGDFADLGDTALQQALEIVLHGNFDGAVITVGNVSGAVIQDGQGRIRYFDSHSNNKIGRMTLDGTAVLLTFDTVQEFVRYIRKRESNPHVRYELIGIRLNAC